MINWKHLHINEIGTKEFPDSFIVYGNTININLLESHLLLTSDEKYLFDQLKKKESSKTQQTCRVILKLLLSKLTNNPSIIIHKNKWGKPFIGNQIFFNVSHTNRSFILFISKLSRTGIDIEDLSESININEIADYAFSENEKSKYFDINSFYKIWTQKEAFLKFMGLGLIDNLNKIDCQNMAKTFALKTNTFSCPDNHIASIMSKSEVNLNNYYQIVTS